MPDVAMHHAFGQEVLEGLKPEIRQYLLPDPYGFALYGPDLWFMYQPWKRRKGRGRRMHTLRTGAFLAALARRARQGSAPRETFSYLAGFLCHYALDATTHPYIIWRTTETWPTPRAHRDLEHALDVALLKREGVWGTKHPVTDHHFPVLRLPDALAEDLDAVYGEVYGWRRVLPALNRCYRWYRKLYRIMEKPRSGLTLLVRAFPSPFLRSIPYAVSGFLSRDVENLSRASWSQPYSRGETSEESFPDLVLRAREKALAMISDAYAYAVEGTLSEEKLVGSLENRSYLSGLDTEDPRNHAVRSLRPPE